jgi:hypothetical protein
MPSAIDEAVTRAYEDEANLPGVIEALQDYPNARRAVAEFHQVRYPVREERVLVLSFPDGAGELLTLSSVGDRTPRATALVAPASATRYAVRPGIGTGDGPPPTQLMTLWALLYAFSQLARYEPEVWVAALNPDRSPYAVDLEHVLDTALDLVPQLLVPAATSGLMPRLIREQQAEELAQALGLEAHDEAPGAGQDNE